MKVNHSKVQTLGGLLLFVCGILLMLEPQFTHLQGHPQMRHFIIVFGAVMVLLSFPLMAHHPKKQS